MLRAEDFAAKIEYIGPFEFRILHRITICYNECVKGNNIMIKDPYLAKILLRNMSSIGRLGQEVTDIKTCPSSSR